MVVFMSRYISFCIRCAGIAILSLIGIILLFEGILRIKYSTIPLTHEYFFTADEIKKSAEYIFEKTRIPVVAEGSGYHIAVIGDSFSACDIFVDIICYPQLIQGMLNNEGEKATITTYATAGDNPDRELRLFIDKILPTHPELVIWQFYTNDVWENVLFPIYTISADHQLTKVSGAENWAYKRQTLFEKLPMKQFILRTFVVRFLLRMFEYNRYYYSQGNDEDRIAWGSEKIRLEIEEMNRLASIYGFKVLYSQIPSQSIYLDDTPPPEYRWVRGYNIRMYTAIEDMLKKQDGYVPVQFATRTTSESGALGATSESVQDRYYMHDDDTNILGDKHLNQAGQQVVADQLMKRIHLLMREMTYQ